MPKTADVLLSAVKETGDLSFDLPSPIGADALRNGHESTSEGIDRLGGFLFDRIHSVGTPSRNSQLSADLRFICPWKKGSSAGEHQGKVREIRPPKMSPYSISSLQLRDYKLPFSIA